MLGATAKRGEAEAPKKAGKMSGWLLRKSRKAGGGWFGLSASWTRGFWVLDFERNTIEEYADSSLANFVADIDPKDILKVKKLGTDKIVITLGLQGDDEALNLQVADELLRDRWVDAFKAMGKYGSDLERKSDGDSVKDEATARGHRGRRFVKKISIVTLGEGGKRTVSALSILGRKSNLAPETLPRSEVSETTAMLSRRASTSDTTFSQPNPVATEGPPSPRRPVSMQARKQRSGSKDQLDLTKNFMSKARNFAISINKDFQESMKKKGVYSPENMPGERHKQRAAIVPVNAPEEKVDRSRFRKSPQQNDMLLRLVAQEFSGLFGGTLLQEVDSQSIVDLMYTVHVVKDACIVSQGDATDKMYVIDAGIVGVYTQDFVDRPPELEVERRAGDCFGVLSLIYNQPAPFMIKTHTDCILWALPSRKFHELSTSETKRRLARKVRLLNGVPLIADNIDADAVTGLAESMEYLDYSQGDVVLNVGTELTQVWIVAEGSARMIAPADDQTGLDDVILSKGDVFGEWVLLGQRYSSDVVIKAETPALSMLCLNVTDVEELVGPLREFVLARWMERQQGVSITHHSEGLAVGDDPDPHRKISVPSAAVSPPTVHAKLSTGGKMSLVPGDGRKGTNARGISFLAPSVEGMQNSMTRRGQPFSSALSSEGDPAASQQNSDRLLLLGNRRTQVVLRSNSAHELLSHEQQELALAQVASEVRKHEEYSRKTKARATIKLSGVVAESLDGGGAIDADDETEGAENLDRPFIRNTPLRSDVDMDTLKFISLLGSGNFGKVHLVQNEKRPEELYALKVLTRHYIVLNGWEKMVENERDAMLELSTMVESPFLLKLFNSFSDSKNVYLLLELCEGGDLYNLMRATQAKRFGEDNARFYIACVVLGLEAMHSRDIVYRDLKPENLMIAKTGYIKVADFGLAKKTLRTFTVCGTPEYMAPEVILSHGHGLACDWWAVGVMLHEILNGCTPFAGGESFEVYERILGHKVVDDIAFSTDDDPSLSEGAKDLIRNLMHPKKAKRLGVKYPGVDAIKSHEFFTGLDWNALELLDVTPPVVPTITHIENMLKDDKGGKAYDAKLWGAPDDHSGWTLTF